MDVEDIATDLEMRFYESSPENNFEYIRSASTYILIVVYDTFQIVQCTIACTKFYFMHNIHNI